MTNYELECFVKLKYGEPPMWPTDERAKYLWTLPVDFLIEGGYVSHWFANHTQPVPLSRGYPNKEEVLTKLVDYEARRFNIHTP